MNKGDELTVTTDEVSRSGNIQSKAMKYVTELKVVFKQTLKAIQQRMNDVGLELHSGKTKIVYCRDYRRQEKYPEVKFPLPT